MKLLSLARWVRNRALTEGMGYALGIVSAILAIEVTRLFAPYLTFSAPAFLCLLAVILTAWYGGFGAAIVTIGISSLLFDYHFIAPAGDLAASPTDIAALALFTLEATLMAYLIDHLKCSRQEAVNTKEQLKCVHEHSSSLVKEQAVERMFADVLNASLDVLKADQGWIQVCEPGDGLKLMHEVGTDHQLIASFSVISAEACRHNRRITFGEVGLRKSFSQLAALFEQYQISDVHSTPLIDTGGHCFGVVSILTRSGRYFVERDLAMLDLYIDQARHILAAKLNEEKLRQWSAELEREVLEQKDKLLKKEERIRLLRSDFVLIEQRERRQLASELHDYLCQLLALAQIKIKQARKFLPPSGSCQSDRHLQETEQVLRRSVLYARSLMAELSPPSLNGAGLPAALRWLAGQMSFHDLAVDVEMSCDSLDLPKHQAILLYRSVRELLINVSKHARVNRATLSVAIDAKNRLSISVQDRGRGFDTSSSRVINPGNNFGLASVGERLVSIGGWLQVESVLGQGSNITVSLPLGEVKETVLRAASAVEEDRVMSIPDLPNNDDQLSFL